MFSIRYTQVVVQPLAAEGLLILERIKIKMKKPIQQRPKDRRMEDWQQGFVSGILEGRFLHRKP